MKAKGTIIRVAEQSQLKESTINNLAKFTEETNFEDLPPEVVDESKRIILDSIACALAGSTSDKGKAGLAFSRYFGGYPEATVIGFGDKVSVLGAAFANGELINALDWDVCFFAPGHIAPAQAQTSWVKHVPPTTAKYLLAGWAAQASLTAALLAELGHRGDLQILDGEFGFWRYMGSEKWEPHLVTNNLGKEWQFPPLQIYKPYPHCRILHGSLDCLLHIIEENGLKTEEIESIHAWLENFCQEPVWNNRVVECQTDAQFSVAHCLAVAAHRIPPGPEWQDLDVIKNPSILALMDKVTFELHPDYVKALEEDSRSRLSKVEVRARGETFAEERRYPKGAPSPLPETFMTTDGLVAKFRCAAQRILPLYKMDPAINAILALEKMDDISDLMELVCI